LRLNPSVLCLNNSGANVRRDDTPSNPVTASQTVESIHIVADPSLLLPATNDTLTSSANSEREEYIQRKRRKF
jgi:hypothetical protein